MGCAVTVFSFSGCPKSSEKQKDLYDKVFGSITMEKILQDPVTVSVKIERDDYEFLKRQTFTAGDVLRFSLKKIRGFI